MRILGLRDPHRPVFFDLVIDRLRQESDIKLDTRSLNDPVPALAVYDLVIFWLLDPLDNRVDVHARACGVADRCAEVGVPVFQSPASLAVSRRSTFSYMLRRSELPLRVASVYPILDLDIFFKQVEDATHPLAFPMFARDNDFHSGPLIRGASLAELRAQRAEIRKINRPVAVEYIETIRDGLYHKYRYVVAGQHGVRLHLQTTPNWVTRGEERLFAPDIVKAERDYVSIEDPIPVFHSAARELGLDFGAFDYACGSDGGIIAWEVNPAPMLHFVKDSVDMFDGSRLDQGHRNVATCRVLDALVSAYRARARV